MKKYIYSIYLLIFIITPGICLASPNGLVIDEFQIGKTGASNDEYIVLANYGTSEIRLDGYNLRIKRNSTSITTPVVDSNLYTFSKTTNYFLKPNEKIIVAKSGYSSLATPFTYSAYISSDYTLYLNDAEGRLIDLVGYGEAPEYEAQPIVDVKADDVWKRHSGQDENNNLVDFYNVNAPEPIALDLNLEYIQISEIFPNPETGKEWIELYNPTNFIITLYGLKACDLFGSVHCYAFTKDDQIYPLSYKIFDQGKTRITLNDNGDEVELRDAEGNVVVKSDEYEDASDGESYSLFGSEWKWTKSPTPALSNVFIDTVELEVKAVKKSKSKAKSTANLKKEESSENSTNPEESEASAVKAATVEPISQVKDEQKSKIGRREIGWSVLIMAVIILFGYFGYENKEKLNEIYLKIRKRNN